MKNNFMQGANSGLYTMLAVTLLCISIPLTSAQMSSDPRLCGGYQRMTRGYLDFKFDENTAPPGTAMAKKFCMWTISPTVPSEYSAYNMIIRNVNLDCASGDKIVINYFYAEENATDSHLQEVWTKPARTVNPICQDSHVVWERHEIPGTMMVINLYVEEVVYGKGFYLEWEEDPSSFMSGFRRIRNTYHSWGKPSVAPNPYFSAGFGHHELATFGFVKPNYTEGYVMEMDFWKLENCQGQGDWGICRDAYFNLFAVGENANVGVLEHRHTYRGNETDNRVWPSRNGFFIAVQMQNDTMAFGRITFAYDTVRG